MTVPPLLRPFLAAVLLLAACEPMAPSGSPLQPVRTVAPPAPAAPVGAPVDAPVGDSPFVEDDPFTEGPVDPDAAPSGLDSVLRGQLDVPEGAPPAAPAPAPAAPPPMPVAPAPAAPPLWDGTGPIEGTGTWGVTLLATLLDVQPPRAVVSLPDGSERVVQPGTFLPEHRLVVLAVGRDAVQLAYIEPMGFKSRVETSTIRSLFSGQ